MELLLLYFSRTCLLKIKDECIDPIKQLGWSLIVPNLRIDGIDGKYLWRLTKVFRIQTFVRNSKTQPSMNHLFFIYTHYTKSKLSSFERISNRYMGVIIYLLSWPDNKD